MSTVLDSGVVGAGGLDAALGRLHVEDARRDHRPRDLTVRGSARDHSKSSGCAGCVCSVEARESSMSHHGSITERRG
jgi:hypothetical protein